MASAAGKVKLEAVPGDPIWKLGAAEVAARIARGELSAVDAVEALIARIEEVNPALNAVVVKRYDEARSEARAADRARAEGRPLGPLHGVPITIKECLDLAGTPSTFGLPSRARELATADDPVVARLRAAGAIVLGKTNVAQLLFYFESDNPLYGRTNHPTDPERTPGGSSGGQAAIIATGGSPIGIGTDLGGSNRVPAAFCGIVGFKPTAGRLPDRGRLSAPYGQRAVVSQVGVFGRSVADAALTLEVANGGRNPDDGDPRPLGDFRAVDLAKLRVGYFTDDGTFTPSPAVRRAVREAADALRARGAQVVEVKPPDVPFAADLGYRAYAADGLRQIARTVGSNPLDRRLKPMLMAFSAGRFKLALLRVLLGLTGRKKLAASLRTHGFHDTDHYFQLCEAQLDYQARWKQFLDEQPGGPIDVILSPAVALPALKHGATEELGTIGGYTLLYNVLGYPAGVLPFTRVRAGEESDRPASKDPMDRAASESERGSAGLPIAVQLAARPWRDHLALAAMAALERPID
jgi:fatty acid amide hydrolase